MRLEDIFVLLICRNLPQRCRRVLHQLLSELFQLLILLSHLRLENRFRALFFPSLFLLAYRQTILLFIVVLFFFSSALLTPHYSFPSQRTSFYEHLSRYNAYFPSSRNRRLFLFFFFFFFFYAYFFVRRSRLEKSYKKRHLHTRAHTHSASSSSSSITVVHAPRRRWGSVFIRGGLVLFSVFVLQICSTTSTNTSKTLYEDIIGFDEHEHE